MNMKNLKNEKLSMLETLKVIFEMFPELLDDITGWNSLYVDYDKPYVERLWRQLFKEHRLYLHIAHPCKKGESFFHNHAGPSAMLVISGQYEMMIGRGVEGRKPETVSTVIIGPNQGYEMLDRDDWHSIRPIDGPTMSLMLCGPLWTNHIAPKPTKKLFPLTIERSKEILELFKQKLS